MWLLWLHLAGLFLFLRFYCAAILPVFVWSFLTVGIAMCRVLLYVVGSEKYTYDRKFT